MLITLQHLQNMKKLNIPEINKSTLTDIKNVEVDNDMPITPRFLKYIDEIKNPYCFLNGDIAVKLEFSENDKSLEESLTNCLITMKNK